MSLACTGVAIFDLHKVKPIYINNIPTNDKQSHGERLHHIREELSKLAKKYPPADIAIERGYTRFNKSTQAIFKVHGIVNELFHDVNQEYYPPMTVKAAIVDGKASKVEVAAKIKEMFPRVKFHTDKKGKEIDDETDAFAVAVTHLIKRKMLN